MITRSTTSHLTEFVESVVYALALKDVAFLRTESTVFSVLTLLSSIPPSFASLRCLICSEEELRQRQSFLLLLFLLLHERPELYRRFLAVATEPILLVVFSSPSHFQSLLTPHSGVIPGSLILCFTSLLCDRLLTPPQFGLPSPIAVALKPALLDFGKVPEGSDIVLRRPELLSVVMSCFEHCAPEDRETWLQGMTVVVQNPESATALATVSDALIDVGLQPAISSS